MRLPWKKFFEPKSPRLLEAVARGDLQEAQSLIQSGANVNYQDDSGRSALYSAALHRRHELVEMLLANGANPNILTDRKVTPLEIAMTFALTRPQDADKIVGLLLDAGCEPNGANTSGTSFLVLATRVSEEAFFMFFEAMDHPIERLILQRTLETAASKGYVVAAEAIFGCYEDWKSEELSSILVSTARFGRSEIIPIIVASGSDPNTKGPYDETPLYGAASSGRVETVKVLLAMGADPNPSHAQPLQEAAGYGHTDVVKALIEGGADINAKGFLGRTPVMTAAISLQYKTARTLIEAGASLQDVDQKGLTLSQLVDAGLATEYFDSTQQYYEERDFEEDYRQLASLIRSRSVMSQ